VENVESTESGRSNVSVYRGRPLHVNNIKLLATSGRDLRRFAAKNVEQKYRTSHAVQTSSRDYITSNHYCNKNTDKCVIQYNGTVAGKAGQLLSLAKFWADTN